MNEKWLGFILRMLRDVRHAQLQLLGFLFWYDVRRSRLLSGHQTILEIPFTLPKIATLGNSIIDNKTRFEILCNLHKRYVNNRTIRVYLP